MSNDNNEIKLDETPSSQPSSKLDISDLNSTNNQVIPLDSKIKYDNIDDKVKISKIDNNSIEGAPQSVEVLPTLTTQIKTEGPIISSKAEGTLNEPILVTLKRDFLNIWYKILFVLNPFLAIKTKNYHIVQWDLWGPLVFNIILSTTTTIESGKNMYPLVFSVFWIGTVAIFFNGKMLDCKLSLFSYGCLLGYSLVPLVVISIPFAFFNFYFILRVILILLCGSWSIFVSLKFIKSKIVEGRTFLMMYPIGLFFLFFIGFLITNHIQEEKK